MQRRGRRLVFAVTTPSAHELLVLDGGTWGGAPALLVEQPQEPADDSKEDASETSSRAPRVLARLAAAAHSIACFAVAAEGSDVVFTGGTDGEIIAWNYKSQMLSEQPGP